MSRGIRSRSCCSGPTAVRVIGQLGTGKHGACADLFADTTGHPRPCHVRARRRVSRFWHVSGDLHAGRWKPQQSYRCNGSPVLPARTRVRDSRQRGSARHPPDGSRERRAAVRRGGCPFSRRALRRPDGAGRRRRRPTPGSRGRSRQRFDFRGQEATMFVTAPVALYSPFYRGVRPATALRRGHLAGRVRPRAGLGRPRVARVRGPALAAPFLIPGPIPGRFSIATHNWPDADCAALVGASSHGAGAMRTGTWGRSTTARPRCVPLQLATRRRRADVSGPRHSAGNDVDRSAWAIGPRGMTISRGTRHGCPNPPGMIQWFAAGTSSCSSGSRRGSRAG